MYGLLFLTGSCVYPTLEMIWRGHTHFSMAFAGGACLCLACLGAAANAARLNGFDPRAAGREENNSDAAREH